MTLNTRIKKICDTCKSQLPEIFYEPIDTRRGSKVYLCEQCGLAQTFYTSNYKIRPPGNMSCNADRSSIRYTKSLVAADYRSVFEKVVKNWDVGKDKNILDIGSNRGAFLKLVESAIPLSSICCIEPDATVINYVPKNGDIIADRVENVVLPCDFYDLAYCVHTLEHVISASDVLEKIYASLRDEGLLILGVPKLELYEDIFEELFIDPHTFHFRHVDIESLASKIGFNVDYISTRHHHDVIVLLRKTKGSSPSGLGKLPVNFSFQVYSEKLSQNRSNLEIMAGSIIEMAKTREVLIWGGGRIFDCLSKTKLWDPARVHVYDKFIRPILPVVNGHRLLTEVELGALPRDAVVGIASRDYFTEIKQDALMLGFSDIRSLEEI